MFLRTGNILSDAPEAYRPLPEERLVKRWVEWRVPGGSWRLGTELHLVRRSVAASSWLNTEIWSEVMCGRIERRNPAELSSSPSTNKQLTSTFALPVNVRHCTASLQIPTHPSSPCPANHHPPSSIHPPPSNGSFCPLIVNVALFFSKHN